MKHESRRHDHMWADKTTIGVALDRIHIWQSPVEVQITPRGDLLPWTVSWVATY
jgi:hypothetical protein